MDMGAQQRVGARRRGQRGKVLGACERAARRAHARQSFVIFTTQLSGSTVNGTFSHVKLLSALSGLLIACSMTSETPEAVWLARKVWVSVYFVGGSSTRAVNAPSRREPAQAPQTAPLPPPPPPLAAPPPSPWKERMRAQTRPPPLPKPTSRHTSATQQGRRAQRRFRQALHPSSERDGWRSRRLTAGESSASCRCGGGSAALSESLRLGPPEADESVGAWVAGLSASSAIAVPPPPARSLGDAGGTVGVFIA